MIRTDLQEAVDLIALVCAGLNALPVSGTSASAADLRRATGAVAADAESLLGSSALPARMQECFRLAVSAGATFEGFFALREQVRAFAAVGSYARIVRQDAIRRAIVQMARALAQTAFQSRDAVLAAQARINAVFAEAEEDAADARDTDTYRALVALHAIITRDLTTRARPLPRIVTYATGAPLPALVLAQQLYGDASRASDLVAENRARAPLFMPLTGRALSS